MRFLYIGDKESISLFGYTFHGEEFVEVTDERAIFKLSNNNHFLKYDDDVQQDEGTTAGQDSAEIARPRRGRPRKQ